jgi:hypothetical protein
VNSPESSRVVDDVKIIPLSATEWRISDATKDERDGLSLLGFVEKTGGLYEITRLGHPREHMHVSSFTAAIDALAPSRSLSTRP